MINLVDAVKRKKNHSESFWIPSEDDISSLDNKCNAKMIFENETGKTDERMWVKITEKKGDSFKGWLNNDPIHFSNLKYKDPINFNSKHIIDYLCEETQSILNKLPIQYYDIIIDTPKGTNNHLTGNDLIHLSGSWGVKSDQNDTTMDAIDDGGIGDVEEEDLYHAIGWCYIDAEHLRQVCEKEKCDFTQPNVKQCVLGAVIHAIDNAKIPEIELENIDQEVFLVAKNYAKDLLNDKEYIENWKSPTKRKNAIKKEIKKIDKVLKL